MDSLHSTFHKPLTRAFEAALSHLDSLNSFPAGSPIALDAMRAQLYKPLRDEPMDAEQVVSELIADTAGGILGSAGGRFFGWVIGGAVPASLAADWLTSTWDQNAGMYSCGPAAAVAEEVAGEWLKELLGLPKEASFAFVTGCQMAHTTCLAAARNGLLERTGWDVERQGLSGAPLIRILANKHRHSSVLRAIRLLGLGTDSIELLPVDEQFRVTPEGLKEAISKGDSRSLLVILQAGEINTGVSDSFAELIPIAHAANAWVHVDGAFGLWARATPEYASQLDGVALADSWATDGHKWLNVPYDSGYAFVRDRQAHRRAFAQNAAYLTSSESARDQMDWNPEFSRRARGFATYAAIRQLGRKGIAELVERCCEHAKAIVEGIGQLPGVKVLAKPVLNQGVVHFVDLRPGATLEDHNKRTNDVIRRIAESGEAFFTPSEWLGQRVMRVSVSNWQTTANDVERVVEAVSTALGN